MWRLRDRGEEQEVPHSQSSAQLWPLPKPFPSGIPGRAEQEIKAGDEHPLSCCCTSPPHPPQGTRAAGAVLEQGISREQEISTPTAMSQQGWPFLHVPSSAAASPLCWAELGAAPVPRGHCHFISLFPWEMGGDGRGGCSARANPGFSPSTFSPSWQPFPQFPPGDSHKVTVTSLQLSCPTTPQIPGGVFQVGHWAQLMVPEHRFPLFSS